MTKEQTKLGPWPPLTRLRMSGRATVRRSPRSTGTGTIVAWLGCQGQTGDQAAIAAVYRDRDGTE